MSRLSLIYVPVYIKRRSLTVSNSFAFVAEVPLLAGDGIVRHLSKKRQGARFAEESGVKAINIQTKAGL